jgi:hypothetical protein
MPDESEPASKEHIESRDTMGPGCLTAAVQDPTTAHLPGTRVSEYQDLPGQIGLTPDQGVIPGIEEGTHWATLTDAEVA